MSEAINEIPLIKRELKCLSDFKQDMTVKFDNRKPAELTFEFINKTNLEMQKQTDNLEILTKTLDTHVADQKVSDDERKRSGEKRQLKLEEYQKEISQKIGNIQTAINTWIEENEEKGKLLIAANDKRYAPKMVYKIMVWAGGIAGAALILGLIGLIYRTIIYIEK